MVPELDERTREAINGVFHLYDVPLWLVTAAHAGRCGGLIASTAVRGSIVAESPRILVTIARQHHTWGLIEGSGRFALHLLVESDLEAVWRFGLQSGHHTDKCAGLDLGQTPGGSPFYGQALAWLDCLVEARMGTGDRSVYLAAVTDGGGLREGPALGVARLLQDAPPHRRAALERLYGSDQAVDAAAILAWRRDRARV